MDTDTERHLLRSPQLGLQTVKTKWPQKGAKGAKTTILFAQLVPSCGYPFVFHLAVLSVRPGKQTPQSVTGPASAKATFAPVFICTTPDPIGVGLARQSDAARVKRTDRRSPTRLVGGVFPKS
jgi:hypothetical protein